MAFGALESDVEIWTCEKAAQLYGIDNVKIKKNGWPDRMFLIPGGRVFFIEFKKPGEPPEPLQEEIIKYLRRAGFKVEVYSDRELALKALAKAVGSTWLPKEVREVSSGTRVHGSAPGSRSR